MSKKITAILLILAMVLSTFAGCGSQSTPSTTQHWPEAASVPPVTRDFISQPMVENTLGTPLASPQAMLEANPQPARDGYTLVPTMFGHQGIDILSTFVLQTPYQTQVGAPPPPISIDGQPLPTITMEAADIFTITPALPLTPHAMYTLRLSRIGMADITWAFQTAPIFEITAHFPRHQSVNVPVTSTIEFYFSLPVSETDIADFFHIYPPVAGTFKHMDNRGIFMPESPLAYAQIYTVTVNQGIQHSATHATLATSHSFQFETALPPGANDQQPIHHTIVNFHNTYVEFPTFAQPSVFFWLAHNERVALPEVTMSLYHIYDTSLAIQAILRTTNHDFWAQTWRGQNNLSTHDLTRIMSTNIRPALHTYWGEEFTIPSYLEPGFYLLQATVGDNTSQMFVQITDLAVQVIADQAMTIVWANDMHTGGPTIGALVESPTTGTKATTGEYGIAILETSIAQGEYIIVTAPTGMETVVFVGWQNHQHFRTTTEWEPMRTWGWGWAPSQGNAQYWGVLQLDRTIFQRDDTIHIWGFLQSRNMVPDAGFVTAIITSQNWWDTYRDPLVRQNIPITNGVYNGAIALPHLDPGTYELAIYHNGVATGSIFFTVQDYVTPPYRLQITASAPAIFLGESITFTASTAFFEGTPVPDLQLAYDFWGWELRVPTHSTARTNQEGTITRTITPTLSNVSAQGDRTLSFSAEATLPEIGWVREQANTRVFVNDIHVNPRGSRTGQNATLSLDIHNITLERLNNGTATHWGDFLCTPVAGQAAQVRIYEIYWEPVRIRERYCPIRREMVPVNRYERRERFLESFSLTTDSNGHATRDFQVPDNRHRSYEARVTTTDGNGRTITHQVFLGRDWTSFHDNTWNEGMHLYGARPADEGYHIGDLVELTVYLDDAPLTQGNFLFVVASGNILSYHIGTNPLTFTFGPEHMPNARVFAYHFNGHIYTSGGTMNQRIHFNNSQQTLDLAIDMCQNTYRPGDEATISVTVTCQAGNPVVGSVNISIVDEALFALMDYQVDTLAALYMQVPDSLRTSVATHRTFISQGIPDDATDLQFMNLASAMTEGVTWAGDGLYAAASPQMGEVGMRQSGAAHLRQRFQDTATFITLQTDAQGRGTFTFQLPDNITTWRVTASGISPALAAGNTVESLVVTQPMFLHYSLASLFLAGDSPYVGVNAFGTSLTGGETVSFEVWWEDDPTHIIAATGTAFARTNIPLGTLTADGALVIRATAAGYTDMVRHPFSVTHSHRYVDTATFYTVTTDTTFATNPSGLTNITFSDHGQGQFLWQLVNMRHIRGARLENLVAQREATRLLAHYFPETRLWGQDRSFDPRDYQQACGGMAILPHGSANLEATVQLLPFIAQEINLPAVVNYLEAANNRPLALHGLAIAGEPVLLELLAWAHMENLSLEAATHIAMGLAALGERQEATALYNRHILPHIQPVAPHYRTQTNIAHTVALLGAKLNMPQAMGLHSYVTNQQTTTPNLMSLAFIQAMLPNLTGETATITYTLHGEVITRNLSFPHTLRIPHMSAFTINQVTGSVGAVSMTATPLEDIEVIDNHITITRQFFAAGTNTPITTFAQDALVRVQITIEYPPNALDGAYIITDFLPAGLVSVSHSARFGDRSFTPTGPQWRHVTQTGQRTTFYDFNNHRSRRNVYYYYARVINPGTFTAQGTIVQSVGAREFMAVGECRAITILP